MKTLIIMIRVFIQIRWIWVVLGLHLECTNMAFVHQTQICAQMTGGGFGGLNYLLKIKSKIK